MPSRNVWLSVAACIVLAVFLLTAWSPKASAFTGFPSEAVLEGSVDSDKQYKAPAHLDGERKIGIAPSKAAANPATVPSAEEDPLDHTWRVHLDQEHGPVSLDGGKNEKTMGFGHIYVLPPLRGQLSKETLQQRKLRMEQLSEVLELDFTYLDDTILPTREITAWIAENVAKIRKQKAPFLAQHLNMSVEEVGGVRPGSIWLHSSLPGNVYLKSAPGAISVHGPQRYYNRTTKNPYGSISAEFPSLTSEQYNGKDWLAYLDLLSSNPKSQMLLSPEDHSLDVTAHLHDPVETESDAQLTSNSIKEWYAHRQVMRLMQKNRDESALIITDDIDAEWDIKKRWSDMHRFLPPVKHRGRAPWHMTFLGHCSDNEQENPPYLHPNLHQSGLPACLNAYVLSRTGLGEVLRLMGDPWIAYQTPLPVALASYIRARYLNAYSADPPLVVSLPDHLLSLDLGTSDVQKGIQASGKTIPMQHQLADSTSERLWRFAGYQISSKLPTAPNSPKAEDYRLRSVIRRKTAQPLCNRVSRLSITAGVHRIRRASSLQDRHRALRVSPIDWLAHALQHSQSSRNRVKSKFDAKNY